MDWVLDKVVDQSDCGTSLGNTKITDADVFTDDAVIIAESLEVLVMALKALHEEAKPLGLYVFWLKTKVPVFGGLLNEIVQSVYACGEILESFTYLGSAVHNDDGSRQEVLRRIGIAHGVMDSVCTSIWRYRYLCRRTKIRIFKLLVILGLLYGSTSKALFAIHRKSRPASAAMLSSTGARVSLPTRPSDVCGDAFGPYTPLVLLRCPLILLQLKKPKDWPNFSLPALPQPLFLLRPDICNNFLLVPALPPFTLPAQKKRSLMPHSPQMS
ncbi:hypothetical protein GWK47_053901 [Chionoecetes opilio]|uniref:Uncharacterized protein n=1 Tax=Chionoecetes opilio TaxID=41210 RepID=A0A8J4Y7H3_CHIOP|nr:hypothetical protein GWK47_053901 [Chionoecetes opilio]